MEQSRRIFLRTAARIATLAAGASLPFTRSLARAAGDAYPFSLGVASGSPLPSAVVLWTRILPDPLNAGAMPSIAIAVRWEVAEDEGFGRIVARGMATAAPELAHSVHVDVTGLAPDRWYWYRFFSGDAVSPVGRTRTAPAPDAMPALLKLAVASCQHWEFGSYAAHHHIAAAAPDVVAFVGDYIYEWGPFQLQHPAASTRVNESFSLDEYRARYAQYKSDPNLQAAHLVAPWIVTWDDHEVANDYANVRDERLDPHFAQRRAAAYQAFYEHMPVRLALPPDGSFGGLRMFQRYDWGRLARFHVLDDRQYRANEACSPPDRGGSSSVYRRNCAELNERTRSILGLEQETWLAEGLKNSRARWNLITQQTLMAQNSQVPIVKPDDGRFWTDGWDGYPAARQRLLEALRTSRASNPVVLGGDVHSFFAADLLRDFNRPEGPGNPVIATEFCGTSITSPSRPQARTDALLVNNPHIKFGRSDHRGYMLLELRPKETTTWFMGLDDVHDPNSAVAPLITFRTADGRPGIERA